MNKVKMNEKYLNTLDADLRAEEEGKMYTVISITEIGDTKSVNMIDENGEETSANIDYMDKI